MTDDEAPRESIGAATEAEGWPVELAGVTETVVTTLGPNGRWNAAALGLFAPERAEGADGDDGADRDDTNDGDGSIDGSDGDDTDDGADPHGDAVTATTWGETRTRRNFRREGCGYVQFVRDPVVFVDAALSIVEHDEPVLGAAAAWVEVSARSIATGVDDGTNWERWRLEPESTTVRDRRVPTIDRGFGAVVEASVLASRLGVPGYDDETTRRRLAYCAAVVDRAGGPRDREALERVIGHAEIDRDWVIDG